MAASDICYSCKFFNGLDEVKTNFATDIYAKLAPELGSNLIMVNVPCPQRT